MKRATFLVALILHVTTLTPDLGGRGAAVAAVDVEADACMKVCAVTYTYVPVSSRRRRDINADSRFVQTLESPRDNDVWNIGLDRVFSPFKAGAWSQILHTDSKQDAILDHPKQMNNVSSSSHNVHRVLIKSDLPIESETLARYVRDSSLYRLDRRVVCRLSYNDSLNIGKCIHSRFYNTSEEFTPLVIRCLQASNNFTQIHVENALSISEAGLLAVDNCSVRISESFTLKNDVTLKGLLVWRSSVDGFERFIVNASFSEASIVQVVNSSFPTADLSQVLNFLGRANKVVWRNNKFKMDDCQESHSHDISSENVTFSFTDLTFVPVCLFGKNLTFLSLSNNRISDLTSLQYPREVPSQSLSYLKLDHNEITDLGTIAHLDILCELSVSHNRISTVTTSSVAQLLWITTLDLSHNRITHVASGAFRLNKILSCLDLSHNRISVIDSSHTAIYRMNFVLDFNHLTQPPFAADNFSSTLVGRVWAANNPYHCDCKLEAFQRVIQRSHAISDSVPERQCSNADPCLLNNDPAQMFFMHAPQYACMKAGRPAGEGLAIISMNFRESCPVYDGCPAPCDCSFVKAEGRTTVDCSSLNLTSLPATLPLGPIDLRLHGNNLGELREAGFLMRVESLDLSSAGLSRLRPVVCDFLNRTKYVNLSDNGLSELPKCLQNMDLGGRTLDLSHNPWRCDCSSAWMTRWIANNPDVFANQGDIRCTNAPLQGVAVRDVDVSRFSCDPPNYLALSVGLVVVGVVLGSATAVLYWTRKVWLALLYDNFNVRPFERRRHEEPEEEMKEFDVFVSYSSKDERWVLYELAPNLEGEATRQPLKLCLHFRHFAVGEAIADNILCAVDHSLATLLILSPAFLASEWCLFEFQQAHFQLLTEGATSLVVVILDDLDPAMLIPELAAFLKNHACLDVRERWFWQKLRYALPRPRKRMNPERDDVNGRAKNRIEEDREAIDLRQVAV